MPQRHIQAAAIVLICPLHVHLKGRCDFKRATLAQISRIKLFCVYREQDSHHYSYNSSYMVRSIRSVCSLCCPAVQQIALMKQGQTFSLMYCC